MEPAEESTIKAENEATPSTEVEEKGLWFTIKIRVHGSGFDETYSHGYCVDDTPIGDSHPIGELYVDIRTTSLRKLRPVIQYNRINHMDRRSKMFQEALFIMSRLPNKYNRPKEELTKFQFGWINKETRKTTLINPDNERMMIVNLIGAADLGNHDLALVPLSQIPL